MQINTQRYGRRPFGVGLLLAGFDHKGPHIYQVCPSANVYECRAMAIGARSQSARTYLDKHLEEFLNSDKKALIQHALVALRDTLPNELSLSSENTSVAIVGKGTPFTIYEDDDVKPYVDGVKDLPRGPPPGPDPPGPPPEPGAMEADPPTAPQPTVTVATEKKTG